MQCVLLTLGGLQHSTTLSDCRQSSGWQPAQVAIKRIPDVLASPDQAKRVLREVAILRRLAHPNVISLRDAFTRPSATGTHQQSDGSTVPGYLHISHELQESEKDQSDDSVLKRQRRVESSQRTAPQRPARQRQLLHLEPQGLVETLKRTAVTAAVCKPVRRPQLLHRREAGAVIHRCVPRHGVCGWRRSVRAAGAARGGRGGRQAPCAFSRLLRRAHSACALLELHQCLKGLKRERSQLCEAAHADSGWRADMQVRSLMAQLMDGLQYLHSQVGCTSALLSAQRGA